MQLTPFLHLPINKTLKIVEGLLRTDGSNLKELQFYNTSLKLIMQLRYLFLRLGILTSGNVKNYIGSSHTTIHGRTITNKKISYCLRIPKHPNLSSIIQFNKPGIFFKYFEWNGILWGRIRSINKINYEGDVYDFNMIDRTSGFAIGNKLEPLIIKPFKIVEFNFQVFILIRSQKPVTCLFIPENIFT